MEKKRSSAAEEALAAAASAIAQPEGGLLDAAEAAKLNDARASQLVVEIGEALSKPNPSVTDKMLVLVKKKQLMGLGFDWDALAVDDG